MSRIALYLDQLAPYYGQSSDFRVRFNDRVR